MEPEHHHKLLIIVITLVAIVVVVLGVMAIIGKKSKAPAGENPTMSEYDAFVKASPTKHSSITDPDVVEFIKASPPPAKGKPSADREAFIKAKSGADGIL